MNLKKKKKKIGFFLDFLELGGLLRGGGPFFWVFGFDFLGCPICKTCKNMWFWTLNHTTQNHMAQGTYLALPFSTLLTEQSSYSVVSLYYQLAQLDTEQSSYSLVSLYYQIAQIDTEQSNYSIVSLY